MFRTIPWIALVLVVGGLTWLEYSGDAIQKLSPSQSSVLPTEPFNRLTANDPDPLYYCKYECTADGFWTLIELNIQSGMTCPESLGTCSYRGAIYTILPAMEAPDAGSGTDRETLLADEGEYTYEPAQNKFMLTRGALSRGGRLFPTLSLEQFVEYYPKEAAVALSSLDISEPQPFTVRLNAISQSPKLAQR